ncbi:MAG TPA: hypothetical protein VMF06_06465 [Candidatus Limnocylindria bacterium]|jgi:hypothetical protein|nr:hypothetical protein [Candidatus Limnocylindria bacterium]
MRFSRKQIILAAVIAFLCAWTPGTIRLRALQRDVQDLSSSVVNTQHAIVSAQVELQNRRQEFTVEEAGREKWLALAAHAENLAAKVDPAIRWITPPENEPTWNPDSPYTWLHKDDLNGLQLRSIAFTASGVLTEQMAAILALDENQRARINDQLTTLLRNFQSSEAANIRPLATLPPEIANQPGAKAGIEVNHLQEANLHFSELYLARLEANLGERRAAFISEIIKDRLTPRFRLPPGAPAAIAVARSPEGSFNILVRSGANTIQTADVPSLAAYFPPYLLPYFANLDDTHAQRESKP